MAFRYLSEMVKITIESGKLGKVPFKEGFAVEFPETAEFFQHGTTEHGRSICPAIFDGEVNQFLETDICTFGPGFFPCLQCPIDTGGLAADVRHLLRESQIGPSAVFKSLMLHYPVLNLPTMHAKITKKEDFLSEILCSRM